MRGGNVYCGELDLCIPSSTIVYQGAIPQGNTGGSSSRNLGIRLEVKSTLSSPTSLCQTVSESVLDVQTFFVCNLLLKLFINAGFDLEKPETNALHCLVGSVSNPENCERLYVAFRLLEQHPDLKFSE